MAGALQWNPKHEQPTWATDIGPASRPVWGSSAGSGANSHWSRGGSGLFEEWIVSWPRWSSWGAAEVCWKRPTTQAVWSDKWNIGCWNCSTRVEGQSYNFNKQKRKGTVQYVETAEASLFHQLQAKCLLKLCCWGWMRALWMGSAPNHNAALSVVFSESPGGRDGHC